MASRTMKQASSSSTDQGGGKRRLGLGTASFLLAISMFQHAIPTLIRPQVRDLALRGLVAMMIAVELTTLLWWRRADDDHQNEGCGIDHGDLFTRSAKRLTKEEARRMVVNFANVAAWPKVPRPSSTLLFQTPLTFAGLAWVPSSQFLRMWNHRGAKWVCLSVRVVQAMLVGRPPRIIRCFRMSILESLTLNAHSPFTAV